jgi:inositol phosphorylceramide mannosyltransferase catalytic subunit
MPAEFVAYEQSWRRHHPDWELVTWTDATLPPLRNQAQFDAATTPAQRADLARYELLLDRGGVYVDCDMECLRPLDELLDGLRAFAGREDEYLINNAIIGAVPGHPVLEAAVAESARRIAALPGAPVVEQTGPLMFTEMVRGLETDMMVFGPERFYPYHFTEPERRGGPFPEAHAVHHWAGSWSEQLRHDDGPLRVAVLLDPARPDAVRAAVAAVAALFGPVDPVELALVAREGLRDPEPVLRAAGALCAEHGVAAAVAYEPQELAGARLAATYAPLPEPAADARALAGWVARLALVRRYCDGRTPAPPVAVAMPASWLAPCRPGGDGGTITP